jgi:glutamate/tyrosine decarboxylase-like PLP-dependent enzyme
MKKQKGEKLWKTGTETISGAQEMIYGIETPKEIKEKYEKENLNEEKKPSIIMPTDIYND